MYILCDICGGDMHLMWSLDDGDWFFVLDTAPTHDGVHLKMKCTTCNHTENPDGKTESEIEDYNLLRFKVVTTMIKNGMYRLVRWA